MTQQFLLVLSQYGLAVVAFNVLLNQIGLPVPAVPTLVLAGAIAANGQLPLGPLFLAAVAALAMLVVGPSGHPLLNGNVYLVVALVTLGACVWLARHRHWYRVASGYAA